MPLFTLITASYNSGEKLLPTLESVRRQQAGLEYILVDGGSTDGSLDLIKAASAQDPSRIRYISEPDRNVYDALNKGIRLATGRYLYFLGAGDTLEPGVLERVAPLVPSHDRAFIYGDVTYRGRAYGGVYDRLRLLDTNICHQAIFYGREIFALCGSYDITYRCFADWEFNLRCFGNRDVIKQHIDLLIGHFEDGGISGQGDPAFERDKARLIRRSLGWYCYFYFLLRTQAIKWRLRRRLKVLLPR